jgi:fumarylacetoacetate (FAA) hydrolase family protein
MSTNPVDEWEKSQPGIERQKAAALEFLRKQIAEKEEEIEGIRKRISEIFGGEIGGKKARKKGAYRMTLEHKKAIQEGKRKRRKEKEKLA